MRWLSLNDDEPIHRMPFQRLENVRGTDLPVTGTLNMLIAVESLVKLLSFSRLH